ARRHGYSYDKRDDTRSTDDSRLRSSAQEPLTPTALAHLYDAGRERADQERTAARGTHRERGRHDSRAVSLARSHGAAVRASRIGIARARRRDRVRAVPSGASWRRAVVPSVGSW